MILKDLRLSPLRSILTSVSMLVGIIAMLGSVLVGTLGREYFRKRTGIWLVTYLLIRDNGIRFSR